MWMSSSSPKRCALTVHASAAPCSRRASTTRRVRSTWCARITRARSDGSSIGSRCPRPRVVEIESDEPIEALDVLFERPVQPEVRTADVGGVLGEDHVADERLEPRICLRFLRRIGIRLAALRSRLERERDVPGRVSREVTHLQFAVAGGDPVAVDERFDVRGAAGHRVETRLNRFEFRAFLVRDAPLVEAPLSERSKVDGRVLVAGDQRDVGLVGAHRGPRALLEFAREAAVVRVPVRQEDLIDVTRRDAGRGESIEEVVADVGHRDPDVHDCRHGPVDQVRVVLPFEDRIPERNAGDVHTARIRRTTMRVTIPAGGRRITEAGS